MSEDRDDPAWDEYLNTGTDPTGGGLGVDDDCDTEGRHSLSPNDVQDASSIIGGIIGILLMIVLVSLCS